MPRVIRLCSSLLILAVALGCPPSKQARRYSRDRAQEALARLETPGILIGEFPLAGDAIVDGDTIKVLGLDTSLRLLAIDTEETFKRDVNRRASESDFRQYIKDLRGEKKRPIKTGTPLGEEAKKWAKEFFDGVDTVRLERDHPKDVRGRFGRYLTYVLAKKNGQWINYNVECVRAGMSPYFTKYGQSRRFHDEFMAAENEARTAKLGVWNSKEQGYGDYDERKAWWDARGKFVVRFDIDSEGKDNWFSLTHWDALAKLDRYIGKEVTILATVGDVVLGDRGPTRVMLSRRMFGDVPAIFWEKDVFLSTGLLAYKREFVRITGTVAEYTFKSSGKRIVQIVVHRPGDVMLSPVPGLEEARANLPPPPAADEERAGGNGALGDPKDGKLRAGTPGGESKGIEKKRGAAPLPEDLDTKNDEDLPVFGPEEDY